MKVGVCIVKESIHAYNAKLVSEAHQMLMHRLHCPSLPVADELFAPFMRLVRLPERLQPAGDGDIEVLAYSTILSSQLLLLNYSETQN